MLFNLKPPKRFSNQLNVNNKNIQQTYFQTRQEILDEVSQERIKRKPKEEDNSTANSPISFKNVKIISEVRIKK